MANTQLVTIAGATLAEDVQLVTMRIDKQIMGIRVEEVREILGEQKLTPIPLVSREIAGLLNLRGRIVTALDIRYKMKLPPRDLSKDCKFVVIENKGELYSLIVDSVGDVLTIPSAGIQSLPPNLAIAWRDISSGVYKLDNELLVILNHNALFSFNT